MIEKENFKPKYTFRNFQKDVSYQMPQVKSSKSTCMETTNMGTIGESS